MKKIYFLAALCAIATASFAQQDSTKTKVEKKDTIRIGSIVIIRNRSKNKNDSSYVNTTFKNEKKNQSVSTNYFVFDLGFAGWDDQTNYAASSTNIINRPRTATFSAADMKLRDGKSANVNLWFFMQKLAIVKNNVNLKYGLGVEYYNYSLRSPISFRESGLTPNNVNSNSPFVYRDSISFSKNKLNLKYLSLPLMLNFATTKKDGKSTISASFGVSASYLIRQRNKQNSSERGKEKNQGEYDMEKFKLSYIAELGLGKVRLYGSYTSKSIFENTLNVRPYSIGIRFSNW
jgi:hypothetical protein